MDLVSDTVRSLCNHKLDISEYDERAIKQAFPGSTIPLDVLSNATGVPGLERWLERPNFYSLDSAAIRAKVALISSNISVEQGRSGNAAAHELTMLTSPPHPSRSGQRFNEHRPSSGVPDTPQLQPILEGRTYQWDGHMGLRLVATPPTTLPELH